MQFELLSQVPPVLPSVVLNDLGIHHFERVINLTGNRLDHHEPVLDDGFYHVVDFPLLMTDLPV